MTRVGFSGKGGVTKHSELTDVSTPHALADLEDAVCSETEADAKIAAALDAYTPEATLIDFQAIPAYGTFYQDPDRMNDNNITTYAAANAIGQYAEVTFGANVKIDQWRMYGHVDNLGTGKFKIEYYGQDNAWHDWVTNIPTRGASWTALTAATEVICSRVRLTVTTVDTYGVSRLEELEVYHS